MTQLWFHGRSTACERPLSAHWRNTGRWPANRRHADLFIYLGRSAAARSWRRTSNGRSAVELQLNHSRNHRLTENFIFVNFITRAMAYTCGREQPGILRYCTQRLSRLGGYSQAFTSRSSIEMRLRLEWLIEWLGCSVSINTINHSSFRSLEFPVNHLHRYWQPNKKQQGETCNTEEKENKLVPLKGIQKNTKKTINIRTAQTSTKAARPALLFLSRSGRN